MSATWKLAAGIFTMGGAAAVLGIFSPGVAALFCWLCLAGIDIYFHEMGVE